VLLEALSCYVLFGVAHVIGGGLVWRWWAFFLPSLFPPQKIAI